MDLSSRSTPSYLYNMTRETIAAGITLLSLVFWPVNPATAQNAAHSQVAFVHALPRLNGKHLKASVVEVTYAPGGSSSPHSHPCPVLGYILEGAVRMQVAGEPVAIYKAGESFYEAPNGVHL